MPMFLHFVFLCKCSFSLFGALMTLLFGLSSAPASQPRNIIIGQGLSMVIGIAFGHADSLTHWMRQTVSTSLAIAAMVKLGVTHPPGAAVALLFSSGEYGWKNLLFVMIGNIIAILCATAINNASEARQFPSYWGLVMCSTSSTVAHDGGATKRSKPIKSA